MSPIPALSRKTLCSTLFTAIIVLIFSSDLWARERTIAVFPFEIHGTEDAANMDKAVTDMFSSRLGKISGYTTVDSSRIKAADADPADMNLENALATGRPVVLQDSKRQQQQPHTLGSASQNRSYPLF